MGGAYRGFRKPLDRVFPLELINFGDVRRRNNAATAQRCNEVQRRNNKMAQQSKAATMQQSNDATV